MTGAALETELKFELSRDDRLPRLAGLGPITTVGPARRMVQTAVYHDTPDLALLAAKHTLRRRTGGTDAGWHLKAPGGQSDDGAWRRTEYTAPLGSARSFVPASLREVIAPIIGREVLLPVCVLRTVRVRRELLDADGARIGLLEDDTVEAWRPGRAGSELRITWREVEVEIVTAEPAVAISAPEAEAASSSVVAAVLAGFETIGVAPSRAPSKLARALESLGLQPGPSVAVPEDVSIAADVTGARLAVWRYAAAQLGVIQALTGAVRDDAPDAVHKMRVATRRLRATLRTIRPWLDAEQTQAMRRQVRWLTRTLGGARDGEVVRERILGELDELPRRDVRGPIRNRLRRELNSTHAQAHERAVAALDSPRYERLLANIADFLLALPWRKRRRRSLHDLLLAATHRVQKRAVLADEADTPAEREFELHEVRKKGKAARYAVEAATKFAPEPHELGDAAEGAADDAEEAEAAARDSAGAEGEESAGRQPLDPAQELAAWVDLQELLGDHQDAVVARETLRRIAAQARAAGEDTYSYGVLVGRETQRLADNASKIEKALARALGEAG
ncbi:CHAD domain-containing protein [Kineosphaera limosa]|uniref:CYTH and CHAD domain-containing protein n=1 Tax=Kineosphaera limosa TaxID=111564 RepID=UPI0002E10B9B|nr:CYTH and CHAD domain-containing protein [Kineosphaera limosa]NYE00321.1 CHAD domain-containing protein [Kineosphaera limosa]